MAGSAWTSRTRGVDCRDIGFGRRRDRVRSPGVKTQVSNAERADWPRWARHWIHKAVCVRGSRGANDRLVSKVNRRSPCQDSRFGECRHLRRLSASDGPPGQPGGPSRFGVGNPNIRHPEAPDHREGLEGRTPPQCCVLRGSLCSHLRMTKVRSYSEPPNLTPPACALSVRPLQPSAGPRQHVGPRPVYHRPTTRPFPPQPPRHGR